MVEEKELKSKKKTNLENMQIDEISLVDRGANQKAYVKFFKNDKGVQMDIEELAQELEKAQSENEVLKALAELSDAEKAYMDKMADDEKKKFMGMSADERKEMMKGEKMEKNLENLEEIEKRFQEKISKAVEEAVTEKEEVIKSLSDENEALKAEKEMAELCKRADDELSNLAGTTEQKAKLLKSLDAIEDEEVRKMALDQLKAKSEENVALTKEFGASGQGEDTPESRVDAIAKSIQKENPSLTYAQAFSKAFYENQKSQINKG